MVLVSCNEQSDSSNQNVTEKAESEFDVFGAEIDASEAVPFAEFVTSFADQDSSEVKLKGVIKSVCQTKGCWMNVTQDGESEEAIFVKFKDYEFFVPKDAAGREVIIEGKAYRTVTSVEDLKHYAEDAGKSQEEIDAITEPKEELTFMANGVLIKS